jgi:hypothetical protein
MANIKISELNEKIEVGLNDIFPIVDTTTNETKKITGANLLKNDYSTNEIKTNMKYIDGKPIYRKVVSIGDLTDVTRYSAEGYIVINTGITNIDKVTSLQVMGFMVNGSVFKNITNFTYYRTSDNQLGLMEFVVNNDSPAYLICSATNYVPLDQGVTNGYATIEYTKTTDIV